MNRPLYIHIDKTKVTILDETSFNIPNICLGKQVWLWIWVQNNYMNVIFSGLSPLKLANPARVGFSRVSFYNTTLFPRKRRLMTENIYDNKSEAYLQIKGFEMSEGTIT